MKTVFIDIDGPLLPRRMWAAADNIRLLDEKVIDRSPQLRFDPGCIGLVVRLCDISSARLVLASNWRRTWTHGFDALRAKMVSEGLRADLWHDDWMLPVTGNKADELASWLTANKIEAGILIDNDPLPVPEPIQMITVGADDGFGLPAYRQALAVFGVADPRDQNRKSAAAEISQLVDQLAYHRGIGLAEVETVIREALSLRLALERNLADLRREWAALIEHDDGTPAFFEVLCRQSQPFIAGRWSYVRMEADSGFCPANDPEGYGLRGKIAASWLSYRDRWKAFTALNPRVKLAWFMGWVSETHEFSSWPSGWEDRLREWVEGGMPDPAPFVDRLEIDTPEWRAEFAQAAQNAGPGWVYLTENCSYEWR